MLSSNKIPIELVEKESNVEFIIAEALTIKTAIIVIYNPSSNFALSKFKEAMGKLNKYLNAIADKEEPSDLDRGFQLCVDH